MDFGVYDKNLCKTPISVKENGINGLEYAIVESKRYQDKNTNNNELAHLSRINLLENNDEKLIYGKKSVYYYIGQNMVSELFTNDKECFKEYSKKLSKCYYISNKTGLSKNFINVFEGCIAILYYPIKELEEDKVN